MARIRGRGVVSSTVTVVEEVATTRYSSAFAASCQFVDDVGSPVANWGDSNFFGSLGGVAACETGNPGMHPANPPNVLAGFVAGDRARLRARVAGTYLETSVYLVAVDAGHGAIAEQLAFTCPYNTWTDRESDWWTLPANTAYLRVRRTNHTYWDSMAVERLDEQEVEQETTVTLPRARVGVAAVGR